MRSQGLHMKWRFHLVRTESSLTEDSICLSFQIEGVRLCSRVQAFWCHLICCIGQLFSLVFKWVGTPFSVYGMLDLYITSAKPVARCVCAVMKDAVFWHDILWCPNQGFAFFFVLTSSVRLVRLPTFQGTADCGPPRCLKAIPLLVNIMMWHVT
jgi:hypothetical protein